MPAPAAEQGAETDESGLIVVENLTDQSEVEYSVEEGISYYRYGVKVRYQDSELVADQVVLRHETGDVIADGNVRLRNENQYFTGDHIEYNVKTRRINTDHFRAGFAPFYTEGFGLEGSEAEGYTARNTAVTTDDVKEPTFKIRAKEFRVVPGKSISARGATVMLGNTPVMYFPYYKRDLSHSRTSWKVTPGYRSLYGPYLRSQFNFPLSTYVDGAVHLDLFERRGVGVGPALAWDNPRWGRGDFQYYYIKDQDPDADAPDGVDIDSDRSRISFSHIVNLRTNLNAKLVIREQRDPFVIRDFFESEYRDNSQPKSFLELNQLWSNWSLDFLAQPQVNDFYQTIERLPDVKLSGLRQQIGDTPLYYESESSLAYLRYEPGLDSVVTDDYAAMRADSFHQILWPQTYFGWLNFVPRVGGRITQYGETHGGGADFDDHTRFVFNTGAELSAKASRVWQGAKSDFFEVNGLRHIFEPSLNYVFVPQPNDRPHELPQFDTEIPSLRLLPVDFPDYNAIDSIDSRNVIRIGLRNRLQTKREDRIDNLVNWALYTDWRLDHGSEQKTFADFYSDLIFRPRGWLTLNSETRFNVHSKEWNAAYHTLTITPNSTWSTKLGHRYFRGGPEFGPDSDNNTFFTSLYYKFNENWAGRISHHYEARDGVLEEQYYTVYRDFRSWTGALTFRVRDRRDRSTDFSVAFTFQLKAFPRFRLGADRDEPNLLLGS